MHIVKHFIKSFLGIAFFFVFLFLAAGKLNYTEGWIFFIVSMFGLVINLALVKDNADLLDERSRPGSNTATWDKKILGLLALTTIIAYTVAGLDSGRFHWSAPFDTKSTVLGIFFVVTGQIIFAVAKRQNNFFSSVARVQTDRNHAVCDRGLYSIVRHPGYVGMIMSWIGFPLVLHSIYSAIPTFIAIILIIIRTKFEDQLMATELNGYQTYQQKVNYRIIPFVW